ncbi:uncharacterized protein BDZ99DRAFT_514051 [Mytilinidion resinicola]|uniref:F-box domain-containing protein n=1 Tax=Mytilinidion resinicola TaxID=574789 RepID=A0A6A6Z9Z5_9PEZI|nr:uncharacterized protein BDZ99DRAFT_514051 [Mytilinidion resinicola]KAF2817836.1 hypothetical protein BDZ99DRAFT_514051 [Mytilinidion resinicola]
MGKRRRTNADKGHEKQAKKPKTIAKGEEEAYKIRLTEDYKRDSYRAGAFPFLALPGELQNRVYEFALVRKEIRIVSTIAAPGQKRRSWTPWAKYRPLTYTRRIQDTSEPDCCGDEDEYEHDNADDKLSEEARANAEICLNLFLVSRPLYNEARAAFYKRDLFYFQETYLNIPGVSLAFLRDRPSEVLQNFIQKIHIDGLSRIDKPSLKQLVDFLGREKLPLRYLGLSFRDFVPFPITKNDRSWTWQWGGTLDIERGSGTVLMEGFLNVLLTITPVGTLALEVYTRPTYSAPTPNPPHKMERHVVAFIAFLRSKLLRDAEKLELG